MVGSFLDGTFIIKIYNRLAHVQYVPEVKPDIDQYGAKHYPGHRWNALPPSAKRAWINFWPLFKQTKIKTIAYVGANDGQIAVDIDDAFPGISFYLIEPVPHIFNSLVRKIDGRKNMHAVNMAAGNQCTYQEMYVDSFGPASSLLPYQPIATEEFPFLGKQEMVRVETCPLDKILIEQRAKPIDMIIMDVQGYEDIVLKGAEQTLDQCKAVVSELSLQPLYKNSSVFDSVYQVLIAKGFRLNYLINPICGINRNILQIDGIFLREKAFQ